MGNSNTHGAGLKLGLSRSNSGTGIVERPTATLMPVEKLAKILSHMSSDEDSVNGITNRAFTRTVFPKYPELGLRIFGYIHFQSNSTTVDRISQSSFKAQIDKLLCVMTDEVLVEVYVKMFATCEPEITRENFRDLCLTAYRLSMDHYPEGPQTCIKIYRTIDTVVASAFHRKESVSVSYAAHWLLQHCPRMVATVHKFIVHVLTTAYRTAGTDQQPGPPRAFTLGDGSPKKGLELTTPVLEKNSAFDESNHDSPYMHLPLSQVWLLATSLPPIYTRPQQLSPTANTPVGLSLNASPLHHLFIKLIGSNFPSHWLPIYMSCNHGLGANRFLTHVLHYRGPTLIIIQGDNDHKFLLAASDEWRESHLYWGGQDCLIMMLEPEYQIIERGPKILYLNTTIRGYPKGLRGGADPRKPSISINEDFNSFNYKGIPYTLERLEVWGCGPPEQREAQLEVKKWEVKEAERQRVVKINAADWVDHPDRYLLELNGRPSYSTK